MKKLFLLFLVLCHLSVWGADIKVRGTVTSASDGEPLIGVSVKMKDSAAGIATNIDGEYQITVATNAVLQFSYVGYETQEIPVNGRTQINVTMKEDSKVLDDVVVIGYGTMKKSDLTGAVVSANVKDFEKSANTNFAQMLQGTVPGLNVGQVSSAGSTPSISIRGKNTISGNSSVLIVIDGIIYNGDLSSINPADIAAIDVLKDASATAVYGAQAANGVILITSKRGESGKAKINFSTSYSWQSPTKSLKPMNRSEILAWDKELHWMKAYTEESGYHNDNPEFALKSLMTDNYMFDENGDITDNDYDWWDNFTRTGHIYEAKLSVSGGSDNSSYMISLGHTDQKNMLLNDDFQRNSIRVNLDVNARKWLTLGVQAFGSFIKKDGQETYLPYLVQFSPLATPYDSEGNFKTNPMDDAKENPYFGCLVDDYDRQYNLFANVYADFKIWKGLTFRVNYGNNLRVSNHNYASEYAQNRNGEAYKNSSTYYDYTLDGILNYNTTIASVTTWPRQWYMAASADAIPTPEPTPSSLTA